MLKELLETARKGYEDGQAKATQKIQTKHMKRAMRRHRGGSIIMTTCMHPELDALLADGWDVVFARTVAVGSARYDLLKSLDAA